MKMSLESGKSSRYNVLADWFDPDGDDLRLVDATITSGSGEVAFTPDGTIRFGANGVSPGIETVQMHVTDGVGTPGDPTRSVQLSTGDLQVTVLPQGLAIKPQPENDFVTVEKGQTTVVHPLANDVDGNDFIDNLCRKLLAYSLGRTLLMSDDALVAEMKSKLAGNGHRFGNLIDCIVTSPQFRTKRAPQDSPTN